MMCGESYPSLVRLNLTISSASVDGTSQFVAQIPIMDAMLMGYWVADQVRNISSSVIYTLRRFIMIPCEMFLMDHLRNNIRNSLIGSGKGRVGGIGGAI